MSWSYLCFQSCIGQVEGLEGGVGKQGLTQRQPSLTAQFIERQVDESQGLVDSQGVADRQGSLGSNHVPSEVQGVEVYDMGSSQ